jgi:8-oxo-dGTP pyrophosphatase MutT (NUDIX family)
MMPAPHIRYAARAAVLHDGHVLLIRSRRPGGDHFILPGGGQEPGETLEQTVRREVLEETCVPIEVGPMLWVREYLGDWYGRPDNPGKHRVEVVFAATPAGDPAGARLGSDIGPTYVSVEWVKLREARHLSTVPPLLASRLARLADDPCPAAVYLGATQD